VLYGTNSTSFAETIVFLEKGANLREERDKFNQRAGGIQGAEVTAYTQEELMNNMGMGMSSLAITLSGKDEKEITRVGEEIIDLLKTTEGISGINSTIYDPPLQIFPRVDYEKARAYEMSPPEVEEELCMMREDQHVGYAKLPDREYEVYIRGLDLKEEEDLEGLYVGRENPIPLMNIAEVVEVPSPPLGIRHYGQNRAEFVNATISGRNKGKVISEVEDNIKVIPHQGVEVEIGGLEELMEENFRWMLIAIVAAVILLYFTMTAIFHSFINSGLVMLSLPLALIGALLSLFVLQRPIGIIGLMGMLMLEGIVLTNAIVLMVFVEQMRKKGMGVYDALVEGGRVRLRPILMTALSTMLALLPLSFGGAYGGVIVTDMAIVVIGGLLTSTVLTLIIIPTVYRVIHHE
jgi:HAE1 family hydrophobic/amphiphilic exporter-1